MISVSKVKENKNKVLEEFKKLKWTEIKNREQGIQFLKNISQNKITHINKNIKRKKNMLKKIDRDIKQCEQDIIKIINYIDTKSTIIADKQLINCPICMENINDDRNSCTTPCGHKFCLECFENRVRMF